MHKQKKKKYCNSPKLRISYRREGVWPVARAVLDVEIVGIGIARVAVIIGPDSEQPEVKVAE